ncbi:MAG: shikimate kinase [Lachnospiraceae bacterium]|nr:shikimate kinase [Lachnospiraceae bacterium]
MGCGKTTIGKKISYRERVALLDTDKRIEQKQKKTINEIFDEDGESAFRQMETECLKEFLDYSERYIISVGGGLPMKEENRVLMKQLGTVIYLKAEPDTIYNRLKNDTTRPLLRGDNPKEKIKSMIEMRNPYYEEAADYIVCVDDKGFDTIIKEILEVAQGGNT